MKLAFMALLVSISIIGCAFQTGMERSVLPKESVSEGKVPFGKSIVWIRSFEHGKVTNVTTAYMVGDQGSSSGMLVSRGRAGEVPDFVLRIIENSGIFAVVTPTIETGIEPDYIVEGNVEAYWHDPWWTKIQLIDLYLHAWIFPTLGRTLQGEAEIRLYDPKRHLINKWSIEYKKHYIGQIWWGITHGGKRDTGYDVAFQSEVLKYAIDKIKSDLESQRVGQESCDRDMLYNFLGFLQL